MQIAHFRFLMIFPENFQDVLAISCREEYLFKNQTARPQEGGFHDRIHLP